MDGKALVVRTVEEKREQIVSLSDRVFEFAEIGFREFKTAALYKEVLEQEGFSVTMGNMMRCPSYRRRAAARCASPQRGTIPTDMAAAITFWGPVRLLLRWR